MQMEWNVSTCIYVNYCCVITIQIKTRTPGYLPACRVSINTSGNTTHWAHASTTRQYLSISTNDMFDDVTCL